ncbi:MAG: SUMF1/EgtB/PvdO family nonheme iron enzyme [Bacteroidales bacterium]|nr:SUMF1/EgtB/PvdO family nonheme iron enzyme [Bacteroidales bacterium]
MKPNSIYFLLFLWMFTGIINKASAQEKRIALIIGNATYSSSPLKNPVNDANLIAKTLQELGFEVIKITNATLKQMQKAEIEFTNKIKQYDVALFYYAGHGIQVDGVNYLIPVDAVLNDKSEVKYEAFDISNINVAFAQNLGKMNIMILDACRNNPFRSWARGGERGFKAIGNQSAGTIIAFATKEGETAADGSGNNGLYTEKLVEQLKIAQNINDVFKNTRQNVLKASNNVQCPQEWDMTVGSFYFTIRNADSKPTEANVSHTESTSSTATGSIQLISEISGKLYIDGVFYKEITAGSTSLFNNIQSGLRIINIRGTSNWTEKVMVISNQTATVRAKNETGTIALYSEINGKLYVDEVFNSTITKKSTTKIKNLTAGVHTLKIEGSQSWSEKVNVSSGQTTNITASPEISNYTTPVATSSNSNYTESSSDVSIDMVFIKGGTFNMGSPSNEVQRGDDEYQHSVTLSDFYMGKYEVTFEQYDKFCDATGRENPSDEGWGRDKRPVINVSWNDAVAYCEWFSKKSGKIYRLPTEAEWEYACRAGTTTPFNMGYNITTSQANCNGNYPYNNNTKGVYREKTMPVGSFAPNEWGLYDMHGNVDEWCSDWYKGYPGSSGVTDCTGSYRVNRGGSWRDCARNCRGAARSNGTPDGRRSYYGFRLVSPK